MWLLGKINCPNLLYMEEVESRALITFTETAPSHWFRYVKDTWVKREHGEWKPSQNITMMWTITSSSHGKMKKETVCPSWTVQHTLKETESSTLRCTEKKNTLAVWLTKKEGKEKEQKHSRGALKTLKLKTTMSFHMLWEHLRNFNKHHIPVHFRPARRDKNVFILRTKTPRHKQSYVFYTVQCSQDCTYLHIRETKQGL